MKDVWSNIQAVVGVGVVTCVCLGRVVPGVRKHGHCWCCLCVFGQGGPRCKDTGSLLLLPVCVWARWSQV